jgi:hypothetical protein
MGEGASFVVHKKGAVTAPNGTETTSTFDDESVSTPLLSNDAEVCSFSPPYDGPACGSQEILSLVRVQNVA